MKNSALGMAALAAFLALLPAGARADFAEAVRAYEAGDYATAFAEWLPLAERGDPAAERNIGHLYRMGWSVRQDLEEAAKWYRRAAEKGFARAQANLANMYLRGQGVEGDHAVAVEWFRRAARQGHAVAQYNLGLMYENGLGVEQSDAKAMGWYHLATQTGHRRARDKLALLIAKSTVELGPLVEASAVEAAAGAVEEAPAPEEEQAEIADLAPVEPAEIAVPEPAEVVEGPAMEGPRREPIVVALDERAPEPAEPAPDETAVAEETEADRADAAPADEREAAVQALAALAPAEPTEEGAAASPDEPVEPVPDASAFTPEPAPPVADAKAADAEDGTVTEEEEPGSLTAFLEVLKGQSRREREASTDADRAAEPDVESVATDGAEDSSPEEAADPLELAAPHDESVEAGGRVVGEASIEWDEPPASPGAVVQIAALSPIEPMEEDVAESLGETVGPANVADPEPAEVAEVPAMEGPRREPIEVALDERAPETAEPVPDETAVEEETEADRADAAPADEREATVQALAALAPAEPTEGGAAASPDEPVEPMPDASAFTPEPAPLAADANAADAEDDAVLEEEEPGFFAAFLDALKGQSRREREGSVDADRVAEPDGESVATDGAEDSIPEETTEPFEMAALGPASATDAGEGAEAFKDAEEDVASLARDALRGEAQAAEATDLGPGEAARELTEGPSAPDEDAATLDIVALADGSAAVDEPGAGAPPIDWLEAEAAPELAVIAEDEAPNEFEVANARIDWREPAESEEETAGAGLDAVADADEGVSEAEGADSRIIWGKPGVESASLAEVERFVAPATETETSASGPPVEVAARQDSAAALPVVSAMPGLGVDLEGMSDRERLGAGLAAYRGRDYASAVRAWLPLAERGDGRAQFYVGGLYLDGTGLPPSRVWAHVFWTLSAEQGQEKAGELLEVLSADMLPVELAEARDLAAAWRPVR